ncbi:hypothetical protein [Natronorubrum sp. DTA28]|uniref:hypothetical protein n=1 Tax=Natronorubrum sp. DTA28 TaxID=3447019 RepID=UPI003F863571
MASSQYVSPNAIKLLAGIILGGVGLAAALETGTDPESISALVLVLSAGLGLIAGVADDIDSLNRALERGYWVIAGLAVFALLLLIFVADGTVAPLVIGFALAFSSGVVVSTIATVVVTSR